MKMRTQQKGKFSSQQVSPQREKSKDTIESLVDKIWLLTNELNKQSSLSEKLMKENENLQKQLKNRKYNNTQNDERNENEELQELRIELNDWKLKYENIVKMEKASNLILKQKSNNNSQSHCNHQSMIQELKQELDLYKSENSFLKLKILNHRGQSSQFHRTLDDLSKENKLNKKSKFHAFKTQLL